MDNLKDFCVEQAQVWASRAELYSSFSRDLTHAAYQTSSGTVSQNVIESIYRQVLALPDRHFDHKLGQAFLKLNHTRDTLGNPGWDQNLWVAIHGFKEASREAVMVREVFLNIIKTIDMASKDSNLTSDKVANIHRGLKNKHASLVSKLDPESLSMMRHYIEQYSTVDLLQVFKSTDTVEKQAGTSLGVKISPPVRTQIAQDKDFFH